ncbi:cbb3-type cytochrome c oxidase N-terminal domain-containing protein [Spirosoma endophyticum]|uniref:Cytochrome c oxidase cbb3-type subunit 3 n=1 Tax=Spirosoma endophyticum TaxID=662367 RepID=A0A1I1HRF2_9BACT|nr:cbb3-type cytochrome c oxidase N-terminal domain-containing protein [Spirosoma endophyticum]SFC24548.1 cytochrome c oxidase cbb3-type subunit 3 [Spirosoma endophyticum]
MNLFLIFLSSDPVRSIWAIESGEELALLLLATLLLVGMIMVAFVAVYLMLILRKALGQEPAAKPVDPRTLWQRIAGLHALSQEKDLTLEHAYDGIEELDNPTPPWFMSLFYSTIAFGVVYLFVFHVFKVGDLQTAEYTQEVAMADQQREIYIKKVAGSINENTVAFMKEPKALDAGKAAFLQSCVACHGQQGQGGVGPNLTDEYWLHGGTIKAVFHTITEGVPEKGMMSWKKQLNPLQVQQVASYILSLQGTKPAGAKAPQGTKEVPNVPAQTDKVAVR